MQRLSKIFSSSKGKKKEGRSARQVATQTLPVTATDQVGDTSSQSRNEPNASEREKIGLFELSKADTSKTIDVVAVHGLQGDAYKTWKHSNGTLWLRDLLPDDVPSARIMTFGYDSTVAFSNSVVRIEDKALDLLNRLGLRRDETTYKRPLIFICHSLGGILVKKALILANERPSDPVFKDILVNTKAIAFLGVPHKGSDSAWWANFAANALKAASIGFTTNNALVADLKKDSSALSTISKQFIDRGKDLRIYTFYERLKLSGFLVVDELSAQLNLPNEKVFPVDADHRTICKISSREDQVYEVVGAWIVRMIKASIKEPVSVENDPISISKILVTILKAQSALFSNNMDITLPIPVLESPEYVKWTSGAAKEILWYRGGPACGKSVMISQVLKGFSKDLVYTELAIVFDFAFARQMHRNVTVNPPAVVISFVVAQLLEHSPNLWSILNEDEQNIMAKALLCTHRIFSYEVSNKSESQPVLVGLVSNLRMMKESILWSCICHIINQSLQTLSRIYLIFDGDDNAIPEDRFQFLRNIRKLWETCRSSQKACVKVLIASRDHPKVRELLDGVPYVDNEKEQQDCLNSLRVGAANARMALIKDGEKSTGQWLLTDPQYLGWRDDPGSALLWLQGNPGTGKSTLMKQIQTRLVHESGLSKTVVAKTVVASFYYSAREGRSETSHKHMLQALLYQILLQDTERIYPFFRPVFRDKLKTRQPWQFEELRSIFVSLSRSHSESLQFYIFLDALDESDRDGAFDVISLMKEGISAEAKLKILLSSRPGPIISRALADSSYHLILEDKNKIDIEKIIASSLYSFSSPRSFPMVSLIVNDIKRLAMDEGYSEAELQAEVKALPLELVPYYKKITSRLAQQEPTIKAEGIRMFRWIVYSERLLTVNEFRDAAAISHLSTLTPVSISTSRLYMHRLKRLDHVPQRLMRNCGELVEVKHPAERARESSDIDSGDVVQLFHETVREFLKDSNGIAAPFEMKETLGHAEIAVVCARYIRMALTLDWLHSEESNILSATERPSPWKYETHRKFTQHLSNQPLLTYALEFLPRHMSFLEDGEQPRTICFECFKDIESDHGLLFLSTWLQTSFNPPLKNRTVDPDAANKFRISSLVAAADQGFATAVKSILELQSTIDAVEETINHSALQIASSRGHLEVVKILIDNEADVNFQGGHFGSALQAAAYFGRDSIVSILIARGARDELTGGYLPTAFFSAVCMGHYTTANLVLNATKIPVVPRDLFLNIWDSDELSRLVMRFDNYLSSEFFSPDYDYEDYLVEDFWHSAGAQYMKMGNDRRAEDMYRQAVKSIEKKTGPWNHTFKGTLCADLASLLRTQKQYDEAGVYYRRAIKDYPNILKEHPDHPFIKRLLHEYSAMIQEMEDQGHDVRELRLRSASDDI